MPATQFQATGTTQATGAPLSQATKAFSFPRAFVITTSTGQQAIVLPSILEVPIDFLIVNAGTATLSIYPPLGGTINGGAVNAAVTLNAGSSISVWAAHGSPNFLDYYTY